jgi:predicted ATPase
MREYWKYKRGSEWRKWDLHIHTPGTKKNDLFEGRNIEEKWGKFIENLNSSKEEIAVVGITDYFCIDNYFKFKKLIKDGAISKKFDMIIPNIELRILPATGAAVSINLHCLFNPSIEDEIEDRFLSKLSFRHSDTVYNASKTSLIRLGRNIKQDNELDEELAVIEGIGQFVISLDVLRTVFDGDKDLRNNTIIVVSNKTRDGVTGIIRHEDFITSSGSQLDTIRQSIYQLTDAIFSSNEGDRQYFIGQGTDDKETVIRKCRSLKPCFHGSDAHENGKLFNPDENRFCWIKADPTFEGLKQTLYEPEDRVSIQPLKPDVKNERYIISELKFIDHSGKLFGNQTILLNENLNSIIGGKSSGKSLLLSSIAKSIDPEQVEKTNKRLGFTGYNFPIEYDFEVTWKNGIKDLLKEEKEKTQKIIYIPQLYINYLVEKDNKDDLNKLVENILLQDSDFKTYYENINNKISDINVNLDSLLTNYLQTRQKAIELQQKTKEIGKSIEINKEIERIQKSIAEGQKLTNLSPQELDSYNQLIENKSHLEKNLLDLKLRKTVLDNVQAEVFKIREELFGSDATEIKLEVKGSVDRIFEEISELPEELIAVRQKLDEDYRTLIDNLGNGIKQLKIEDSQKGLTMQLEKLNILLNPFLIKLEGQKELIKLMSNLDLEKKKQAQAIALEKQFELALKDYSNLRARTVILLKERIEKYESIAENVNNTRKEIGSGVTLECSIIYKQNDLPLFHQVNKAAISRDNYFNNLFEEGNVKYNLITELYSKQLWIYDNKVIKVTGDDLFELPLKQGYNLEEVLRGLIKDSFIVDFTVTYKGDDLLRMSPGKKGTVLLILFLEISSSAYPILIDQPEDNLDNRTIYELLCNMIKEKKKDRQIIIVSHNANLVVATDSENIIIANQKGQESTDETGYCQFEYVNGPIEYTVEKNDAIKEVLFQQGIREHICDILEGGNEAFKQRERKYSIK